MTAPSIPGTPGIPGTPSTPSTPSSTPPSSVGAPVQNVAPSAPTLPVNNGQQGPTREYNNYVVGKINYTAKQLFEITGFVDLSKKFPDAAAFVTFIPGIPDNTKQTGITYNQSAKETMKIGIRDLFALGEAIESAVKGFTAPDFIVFTDSSKFEGNTGAGITKQISIGAGEFKGKPRVYINYKGTGQIQLSMDKWHALGLAQQIKCLANSTLDNKFLKERENYAAYRSNH